MNLPEIVSDLLPEVGKETVLKQLEDLDRAARDSVGSCLRNKTSSECVVCFSGGIDSSILGFLSNSFQSTALLGLGEESSQDIQFLKTFEVNLLKKPILVSLTKSEIEEARKRVVAKVQVSKLSQLEDCTAFYLIGEKLNQLVPRAKYILTANGPDELFCGYDRFRRIADIQGYAAIDEEIIRSLDMAQNLKNDVKTVLHDFGIHSTDPFLQEEFIRYCKNIPAPLKILKGDDRIRKRLWRLYGRVLGLPDSIVLKPKKAMQYSMGIHKTILKNMRNSDRKENDC